MVDHIQNYLPLGRIGTAGQPTAEQFTAIKAAGYQVVVNLSLSDSLHALPDEAELVAEQGMIYEHIPVIWEMPALQDLERFFAVMEPYRQMRVFVHCVVNKRASVFVYLYRVLRLRVPEAKARDALLRIWEPDPVWHRFISDAFDSAGFPD